MFFSTFAIALVVASSVFANMPSRASKTNIHSRFSSILKSRPKEYFESDTYFENAHNELLDSIQSKRYDDRNEEHTFFIELREGCGWECHKPLLDSLGPHHYKVLSADHAQITTKLSSLEKLRVQHKETVLDYIPLIPESKICETVRNVETLFNQHKAAPVPECKDQHLRVLLPPVRKSVFEKYLNDLGQEISAVASVYRMESLLARFVENEEFSFKIEVKSCDHMLGVAKTVAKSRLVTWVEYAPAIVMHNRWTKGVCDTGEPYNSPLNENNITGEGEVIGISDTGIDLNNGYFYDDQCEPPWNIVNTSCRKVINYIFDEGDGDGYDNGDAHGTHVAGSAAGKSYDNYGSYKMFNGMAVDAKIAFFDIENNVSNSIILPNNINTGLFERLLESGARVITNSWGTENANSYDNNCKLADTFMWNNPDALVLFSAGNSGPSSNTVNSPGVAKNVATVGASLNAKDSFLAYAPYTTTKLEDYYDINTLSDFSSRGPTADNRMKPDILAPGFWVTSAKGYSFTSSLYYDVNGLKGTSMASPTAAGFAIKIRQFFMQGYYPSGGKIAADGFTPSGSLLKGMLVASTLPMEYEVISVDSASNILQYTTLSESDYPSKDQGYGRILMKNILQFAESGTNPISLFVMGAAFDTDPYYAEITTSGQDDTYTFTTATTGQGSVRIVLTWTEPPSEPSVSNVMLNPLTVSVTSSLDGSTFTPYLTAGAPTESNVQVIDISSPTANTVYTVTVSADGTLSQGPQPYSLVVVSPSALTYLPDTFEGVTYTGQLGRSYISSGARMYIAGFSILCFFLLMSACWNRKLRKKPHEHHHHRHDPKTAQGGGEDPSFAFIPDVDVPPENTAPKGKKGFLWGYYKAPVDSAPKRVKSSGDKRSTSKDRKDGEKKKSKSKVRDRSRERGGGRKKERR